MQPERNSLSALQDVETNIRASDAIQADKKAIPSASPGRGKACGRLHTTETPGQEDGGMGLTSKVRRLSAILNA